MDNQGSQIGDEAAALIAAGKTADEVLSALDLSAWVVIAELSADAMTAAAATGAEETIVSLGVDLPEDATAVDSWALGKDYAKQRGAEMVGMKWVDGELVPNPDAKWQITEGTRDMLRGTVERAIDEGMTTDEAAAEIADSRAFSESRARMIARTEMHIARAAGGYQAAVEMGATRKQWSTSQDDLVSEECAANGEEGPIPIDQPFSSGDMRNPAHPNCRCVVNYSIGEDDSKDAVAKGFNPDQPRDELGRFAGDGSCATLTGNELGQHETTPEMRKAAMSYAEQHLIGKTFTNASSGHEIKITRQGMKHGLNGANPAELKVTPALGSVLHSAKHVESVPDRLGRAHIHAAHKYSATVTVGKETLTVGVVTHEKAGGIEHYDHFILNSK